MGALARLIAAGRSLAAGPGGIMALDTPLPVLHTMTGGTTGAPRTVQRSHASWIASFAHNAAMLGLGAGSPVAVLGDLRHSLALYAAVEALHLGARLHDLAGLLPRAQHRHLARHGVRALYATPAQLHLLSAVEAPLPDLKLILCGGGTVQETLRARLAQVAPNAELRVFYGASETSFITMADAASPVGSVGRAYGEAAIALRDMEGDIGMVWVRSPYLSDGYVEGDGHLQRDGGWMSVGEMGRLDNDGNLFLAGRRDRMVRIAERWVFPETIEAFIAEQPGTPRACVVTRHDGARGQHLVGVLEGADNPALAAQLDAAVRSAFGTEAAPRDWMFVATLPLTAAGKPDLKRITAMVSA